MDLLDDVKTLDALEPEEQEVYAEEAEYYLSGKCELGFPEDIINRAKRENVELPKKE